VGEWIKGRPVKIQPGTNIYAVIFCTLSRAGDFALTNLCALQKDYQDRGLITIVVSDDAPETLRNFIQVRGGDINFTVAADDLARKTGSAYEHTFNVFMSPAAFVVGKDGNVLWYGHPLREGMGEVVDDIVNGRYDMKKTGKKMQANLQMDTYLAMARQDDPQTARVGLIMLRTRTNDAPALCDLAFQIATAPGIVQRDADLANKALDRAAEISTTNTTDIIIDRAMLLFQTGKEEQGLAKAKEALATAKTDEDKGVVNACIRAMEYRIANNKTNEVPADAAATTNAPAGNP